MANPADFAPIREGTFWLPKASSTISKDIDFGWDVAYWISIFFFFIVVIPMFLFFLKYKRKAHRDLPPVTGHNTPLEILWSVIPLAIVMACFLIGFQSFVKASVPPAETYNIDVVAQKWLWTFNYPNGYASPGELRVPAGKPIRLTMSSKDVIHSFYVPEFRSKQDVVPGNYTTEWFEPNESLMNDDDPEHPLTKDSAGFLVRNLTAECTEYCGKEHSGMLAHVVVMKPEDFTKWLESQGDNPNVPQEQKGKELFSKFACNTCHSLTDTPIPGGGPAFKGMYGRQETMSDGTTLSVNDDYIKESILFPQAKIVRGFGPIMPSFKGQLTDKQIGYVIAYLKTIK